MKIIAWDTWPEIIKLLWIILIRINIHTYHNKWHLWSDWNNICAFEAYDKSTVYQEWPRDDKIEHTSHTLTAPPQARRPEEYPHVKKGTVNKQKYIFKTGSYTTAISLHIHKETFQRIEKLCYSNSVENINFPHL